MREITECQIKSCHGIFQGTFQSVFGEARKVSLPTFQPIGNTGQIMGHFYVTSINFFRSLTKLGVTKKDITNSMAQIGLTQTYTSEIFKDVAEYNGNNSTRLRVTKWGQAQFEIICDADNLISMQSTLVPVLKQLAAMEKKYDAEKTEIDTTLLAIAAKFNSNASYDGSVHFKLFLKNNSPQDFVRKVVAGLPETVDVSTKKGLEQELFSYIADINKPWLATARVINFSLSLPSARALVETQIRLRDIEVSPAKTQASRG